MKKNIMNQNNNEAIENILSLTKDEFIRHDVVGDCIDPYTQKPLLNGDETPMEKYQSFKNANFDYDADVSIQAMCAAREAYAPLFEEGGDKDGWYFQPQDDYDYKYNKEKLKLEIKNDSKTYTYRGDTMNTIATTLGEFRRIFGTTVELPEEADRLADLYHTFGNFMLLPYRSGSSINRLRGFKKSHDYFDLFLLAVYNSYFTSAAQAEKSWKMVDILGENSRALTLFFEYLGQIYGLEKYSGWNHFIEYNLLQDYVELNPDGSFGKPKELWNGHFTGDVMPKTMDEFKQFWKNAADRILARGARIFEKLHSHDESRFNGPNKRASKKQENEALLRLDMLIKKLNLKEQILDNFKKGIVSYCYMVNVEGVVDTKCEDPKWKKAINQFEEKTNDLVYLAMVSNTSYGEMISMLYVSADENEEEWEWERPTQKYISAYVHNFDGDYGEYGEVVVTPMNGALIRVS